MPFKQNVQFNNRVLPSTIGMVYIFFGLLKFFSNTSPAEDLVKETLAKLTFNLIPDQIGLLILASFETFIGIALLVNLRNKYIIYSAIVHIVMTFTPVFILPELLFGKNDFTITLLSQYIFKNIIILGALLSLIKEYKVVERKVCNEPII
ncbi:doxx family protein [Maribacter spongiicola]|uniref:doxx family protein n=1 Tax=Maribacter spongiicola TaxID=1206753 RepID=UPI003F9951DF